MSAPATFVTVVRIEHDVGGPPISLNALTGHRLALRRMHRPTVYAGTERNVGSRCLPTDVILHLLEIGLQAIQLFAISRGSHSASPPHVSTTAAFLAGYGVDRIGRKQIFSFVLTVLLLAEYYSVSGLGISLVQGDNAVLADLNGSPA